MSHNTNLKGTDMPVSEDGVPYGSIDVNEIDSIDPKTDEAKAAVDALKARIQEGQEQANADAEKQAEAAKAQDPTLKDAPKDSRDAQGKPVADEKADQKAADEKAKADAEKAKQTSAQSHGTTSKKE